MGVVIETTFQQPSKVPSSRASSPYTLPVQLLDLHHKSSNGEVDCLPRLNNESSLELLSGQMDSEPVLISNLNLSCTPLKLWNENKLNSEITSLAVQRILNLFASQSLVVSTYKAGVAFPIKNLEERLEEKCNKWSKSIQGLTLIPHV
ncbi:unnamed protein product [Allacma fusca]|uniref:Uncharacterized protein n=1 Tax=Allacma fusca TaxID=39272 RepID=A0A8J2KTL0_9HEXA|nr:unnamed protein product [Allacma fusca]